MEAKKYKYYSNEGVMDINMSYLTDSTGSASDEQIEAALQPAFDWFLKTSLLEDSFFLNYFVTINNKCGNLCIFEYDSKYLNVDSEQLFLKLFEDVTIHHQSFKGTLFVGHSTGFDEYHEICLFLPSDMSDETFKEECKKFSNLKLDKSHSFTNNPENKLTD